MMWVHCPQKLKISPFANDSLHAADSFIQLFVCIYQDRQDFTEAQKQFRQVTLPAATNYSYP